MSANLKLNFPVIKLRARQNGEQVEVWDNLRGIYLVLTPEEWVRRHLIAYLIEHCGVEPLSIIQEYPVSVNGQPQRADVVVVDSQGRALILVECKAPQIDISAQTLDQAQRYNSVVRAEYVILTNGLKHFCYQLRDGRYCPISEFPHLGTKNPINS